MNRRIRILLISLYALATVQLVWCYLWLVRPYVQTVQYEHGEERMPFQGRLLMMAPMRWAHTNAPLVWISSWLSKYIYWFPRVVSPEVLVQGVVGVLCLAITGVVATRIYQAASPRQLLTPLIYPIVLILCVGTYVLHTIQNFRFIYDLPSLAFFAGAMYVIYFRRSVWWFIAIFLVATINRETTLLLLGFFLLDRMVVRTGFQEKLDWRQVFERRTLAVVAPLALYWVATQIVVRHIFAANRSEFYPRVPLNLSFFISPQAWPQLLGGCCYLLPIVLIFRGYLKDARLRAWLWVLPPWFGFMFVYGILIETRIFGELIPYIAAAGSLMAEEAILKRLQRTDAPQMLPAPTEPRSLNQAA